MVPNSPLLLNFPSHEGKIWFSKEKNGKSRKKNCTQEIFGRRCRSCLGISSPGHEPQKSFLQGLRFFCIFEKSGKNEATDLAVSQLRGSTIVIFSAHVPGPHMWASAGPGRILSSPKHLKSDGRVKIYNSVSSRSPLTKSKKKNYRERSTHTH